MISVSKLNFGVIVNCAFDSLREMIFNSRNLLLSFVVVFIQEYVITPLREASEMMNQPVNILEPFIAISNSGLFVLVIPILYMVLMSDFPKMSGNMLFALHRTGKLNWLFSQYVALIVTILLYVCFFLFVSVLLTLDIGYMADGWSLVATDYDKVLKEQAGTTIRSLLPMQLFNQMSPYKSVVRSFVCLVGYLFIVSAMELLFTIIDKKVWGYFISGFIISAGAALCSLNTPYMWLFPMSHATLWLHYDALERAEVFPLFFSYCYLFVSAGIIVLCSFLLMKKNKIGTIEEVDV